MKYRIFPGGYESFPDDQVPAEYQKIVVDKIPAEIEALIEESMNRPSKLDLLERRLAEVEAKIAALEARKL